VPEEIRIEEEVVRKFIAGLYDGTAPNFATEECTFNPPGASPMPIKEMCEVFSAAKSSFPDWEAKTHRVSKNEDGSYEVHTQQFCGAMKADFPATGPFPTVALADADDQVKEQALVFVIEVGTYSVKNGKVSCATYAGATAEAGEPTPWIHERWNQKGDLSDTGFGLLFEMMGHPLQAPSS